MENKKFLIEKNKRRRIALCKKLHDLFQWFSGIGYLSHLHYSDQLSCKIIMYLLLLLLLLVFLCVSNVCNNRCLIYISNSNSSTTTTIIPTLNFLESKAKTTTS